jgi:hypothetical protein
MTKQQLLKTLPLSRFRDILHIKSYIESTLGVLCTLDGLTDLSEGEDFCIWRELGETFEPFTIWYLKDNNGLLLITEVCNQ